MKLSLLMLLRNHLPPSPRLMILATRKVVPLIRTAVAGKDKGIGRRNGGKPMQEKGSLHFLSSISTGWYHFLKIFINTMVSLLELFYKWKNLNLNLPVLYSGEVQAVKGIKTSLSVGQVVWAPSTKDVHQYLVFVGWSSDTRKLGIKYCYNRPCALYAVRTPLYKSEANELELKWVTLFCKMIFFITFFFM